MTRLRLLLLLALLIGRPASADPIPEYDMKATFLYNFALFVEWPTPPGDAFNICILGQDNFGSSLRKIEGKQVAGRPISVARLSTLTAIRKCQILFVADSHTANMSRILGELGENPVLTVTESQSNPSAAISLVLDGQRLVFDINQQRTKAQSLSISSKLLRLARTLL